MIWAREDEHYHVAVTKDVWKRGGAGRSFVPESYVESHVEPAPHYARLTVKSMRASSRNRWQTNTIGIDGAMPLTIWKAVWFNLME